MILVNSSSSRLWGLPGLSVPDESRSPSALAFAFPLALALLFAFALAKEHSYGCPAQEGRAIAPKTVSQFARWCGCNLKPKLGLVAITTNQVGSIWIPWWKSDTKFGTVGIVDVHLYIQLFGLQTSYGLVSAGDNQALIQIQQIKFYMKHVQRKILSHKPSRTSSNSSASPRSSSWFWRSCRVVWSARQLTTILKIDVWNHVTTADLYAPGILSSRSSCLAHRSKGCNRLVAEPDWHDTPLQEWQYTWSFRS